jgi:adenine-specific DNA-methyltransferase
MKKHKTLGQVYTPDWIIDEILDLVNYNSNEILTRYILEPSCGDGAFLKKIVARYIAQGKIQQMSNEEIVNGLEEYIVGIELDEEEFNKCIDNLNVAVSQLLDVNVVNWKIYNENTLFYYNKFETKFDYIVGNPPYIRIHNLDIPTRDFIKENFVYSEGTIDIYLTFFEMAFVMIKEGGKIGYITPNSYLHNNSYDKFRDFLKSSSGIEVLIDFKGNKVFKGYSTYTAITIIQFNSKRENFIYKELVEGEIKSVNTICFKDLNIKDWSFTHAENENFLKNLHVDKNTFINELFDVQYGFATLRDKIFIGKIRNCDDNNDLVYFNEHLIEKKILKTCIKGSTFKGVLDDTIKIIFPYKKILKRYVVISEEEMQNDYPYCYQYFLSNKVELTARDLDKGAVWYEYGRSQGVQSIHNEKIVLSTLVNDCIHYYKVPSDVLMYSGIFITKKETSTEWSVVENMLSSNEFYQFIRITGKDFSGGYKSISSKQIKNYKVYFNDEKKLFNYE